MLGSAMTLAGAWLRCLVTVSGYFQILSIGTIVAALGQVCFINTSSKMATTWFGDQEVRMILLMLIFRIERPSDCIGRTGHADRVYYGFHFACFPHA
jgi:hypothetical protein